MVDTPISAGGEGRRGARRQPRGHDRRLTAGAWLLAAICIAPIVSVAVAALLGDWGTWASLAGTVLGPYAWTTLQLVIFVGLGVGMLGTGAAWLVTNCDFPGRRVLEIALALPLAFPAYVLAYAYTDLLDHPGPVQTALRSITGWGPRDYWFPEIRSLGGAAVMLILVLYPYVYLLVRAALMQQSVCALQVARTLGCGSWGAALRVTLPMARPAISGGIMLALMETIADYGTVAHFGVRTFSTGIFKAWFSMGDRVAAAQLSLCLLGAAVLLATIERIQRGAALRHQAGSRYETVPVTRLRGWKAAAATTLCLVPVLFGFVVPVLMLGTMAADSGQDLFTGRYIDWALNSILLAAGAALIVVGAATLIGYASRLSPGPGARFAQMAAGLGYAVPGGVIAVGLLVPLGALDREINAVVKEMLGVSVGLLITGTVAVLVLAYATRFMAVALNAVESGLATIRPTVDQASRVLGCTGWGALRKVHVPLLRGSILTALMIVFVDVMKELPATLILRPFNFDTLAVQAHRLASDERLAESAVPSLVIVAFGLIPVALLSRQIRRSRPGHGEGQEGEDAGDAGAPPASAHS